MGSTMSGCRYVYILVDDTDKVYTTCWARKDAKKALKSWQSNGAPALKCYRMKRFSFSGMSWDIRTAKLLEMLEEVKL